MTIEKEERLRRLTAKINVQQTKKVPERSSKLAYVAIAPRAIQKKQKKYGTGPDHEFEKKQELKSKRGYLICLSFYFSESVQNFIKVFFS